MLEIKHQDTASKGEFYVGEEGHHLAERTNSWAGTDKPTIDHTWVDDKKKKKKVGRQLVDRAVELARQKNVKILPLCTFAKSVFDKDSSIRDVLFG